MYISHSTCMLLLISASVALASDMKHIKKWHHANEFAGKAVAYAGQGYYGNNNNFTWASANKQTLQFAVINKEIKRWESGEKGYQMLTITKSNKKTAGTIAITDSQLESSKLGLRLLTAKEKAWLKKAIKNQEAFLQDGSRRLPLSMLDA